VAGAVRQAGLVQQLLVGQPEAGDARVVRRGERLQGRVAQQALGHDPTRPRPDERGRALTPASGPGPLVPRAGTSQARGGIAPPK